MKKKIAMRVTALALCVVFTGMLFGAPKAEAVAVEATAVAIGVAVLGSYVAATRLRFTSDMAETISNGITSLVSDWVESSAVAASADDWLANLGNTTQMTSPGILKLMGIHAREVAQFVEWLMETFGLDEDGKEAVVPSVTADRYLYSGVDLPALPGDWQEVYHPYLIISCSSNPVTYILYACPTPPFYRSSDRNIAFMYSGGTRIWSWTLADNQWGISSTGTYSGAVSVREVIWSNVDIVSDNTSDSTIYFAGSDPVAVGALDLIRDFGFANPAVDAADDDNLTIVTGLTSSTLSDLAVDVPAQIAAGEFAPTVELTLAGEGTDDPAVPDDATVVPGVTPWLESIFNVIKGIADKIVSGIKGLFVPDQAAVDSFSDEVDAKLPFIGTLQGFGGDLAYKLEHPEECANGLGLTTVVDLEKGRGSYLGTAKHDLLDVSWYLEYKPMVDDIIVGFCWLCFLWNCYGALPRIIHGEGSIAGVISILRKEDGNP